MIKIGPGGIPHYSKSHRDAVKDLSARGLMAMEVEFVYGVRMSPEKAEELAKRNKEFVLTAHAPYYINLLNPEKREASIQRIYRTLDRANRFGAPSIAVHPGYYGKFSKEEAISEMDAIVGEIGDWMKEQGIRTLLGFETTGRVSQFGTLDEILELMKHHKHLTVVVDFAHIYARNRGEIDFYDVLGKLKRMGTIHSHFSGIEFGDKGEKMHLVVGSRKPDFSELVKAIVEMKFHKKEFIIICESPEKERDSETMAEEVMRALKSL